MNDTEYMRLALELAKKGCGWTSPNPMVGAVIVKDGQIIGQGWHERYGQPHAERNALASCAVDPEGATMYVTLEPCCHFGKQPPCVNAILEAGISRVVVGSADPNPLVSGKGIAALRVQGVAVTEGVLREECDALNRIFFHFITTKRPFVSMKYAMTMDGKIATVTGASKWITSEAARADVQQQRHRFSGIMVGVGTILADDPLLTCHMENGKNPVRIVCDTQLRTPLQAQVVATAKQIPTILATCCADPKRQAIYRQAGCRVICLDKRNGHIDLVQLMEKTWSGTNRQRSSGRRRDTELGSTGKRRCSTGAGVHCPKAVRRTGSKNTGGRCRSSCAECSIPAEKQQPDPSWRGYSD